MTWTYGGDPSANDRDEIRFLIGDTDTNDQQVTDEEIAFLITNEGSNLKAAIAAVKGIMAKYARYVDKSVGDLRLSYSQRKDAYKELLKQLERRLTLNAVPTAGGISIADKETQNDDTDRTQPAFYKGQFDPVGTPQNNYDIEADSD